MAEALVDRLRWTGALAMAAADTLRAVWRLAHIHAHRADLRAAPAARAARFIQRNAVEAHAIK